MSRKRHILAAVLTGLAFAAGACGDDEDDGSGKTNNEDSVVQDTAAPDQDPQTAPGPGGDEPPKTTRTDEE